MPVDYETTIILQPTMSEEEIATCTERVSEILTAGGATIAKINLMGRRRLAYEINKNQEGFYVLITFSMEKSAETLNKLEQFFHLQEDVIRYLTVIAPDPRPRGRRKDKKSEKAKQLVEQSLAEGEVMAPTPQAAQPEPEKPSPPSAD